MSVIGVDGCQSTSMGSVVQVTNMLIDIAIVDKTCTFWKMVPIVPEILVETLFSHHC